MSSELADLSQARTAQPEPLLASRYCEAVRPSFRQSFRALMWRTFLVSWRRCRWFGYVSVNFVYISFVLGIHELVFGAWASEEEHMPVPAMAKVMVMQLIIPYCYCQTQVSIFTSLVAEIVYEKESKMKAVQLANGVPSFVYWLAYLAHFSVFGLMASGAWAWTLSKTCLAFADPGLIFSFLAAGYVQAFCLAVFFSTVLNKTRAASTVASFFGYIVVVPALSTQMCHVPDMVVYLTGFVPIVSNVWWLQSIFSFAMLLEQPEWSLSKNFLRRARSFDTDLLPFSADLPSPGALWLLAFGQAAFWILVAYWFDQVWQGDHGAARPWNFCCRRSTRASEYERDSSQREPLALDIQELTKVFKRSGQKHVALDQLTMDVRSGEIFALLGHNGAGKTTAINCVTGMMPMTSGEAFVMGFSCKADIDRCRWNLAICPQDNPMYEELTVDEHLRLFARLRGCTNVANAVPSVLTALGMLEKRHAKCSALSGGQQRRMWVATSLLGNTPLVFLDEPTSGMDPASRRELWDLLIDMKDRGRSILFTTHYLQEADVLADRKAVLASGCVKAMGTSRELKMQFGVGYHLRLLVSRDAGAECLENLRALPSRFVEGSSEEDVGDEHRAQAADAPLAIAFTLPFKEVAAFGPLLSELAERKAELQVVDYELAMTSLEEVFMAMAQPEQSASGELPSAEAAPHELGRELERRWSRKDLWHVHFYALLCLRLRELVATPKHFCHNFLTPMIMILYGIWMDPQAQALSAGFAVSLPAMRAVVLLVRERATKVRHVMQSQGMPPGAYWISTCCSMLLHCYLISLISPLHKHFLLEDDGLQEQRGLLHTAWPWIIAAVQPVPVVLASCVLSGRLETEEGAMRVASLLFLVGGLPALIVGQLWTLGFLQDHYVECLHIMFCFLTPFYVEPGVWIATQRLEMTGPQPITGDFVLWAPLVGGIAFSVNCAALLVSQDLIARGGSRSHAPDLDPEDGADGGDADVRTEEQRVREVPAQEKAQEEACLYLNLQHTYKRRGLEPVHAVRGISLGVKRGECFGLLGPNGAGKTTTLACLTGEIRPPSEGEVYVAGHSVSGPGVFEAYKHLGNCPQVDPIMPSITGRRHLEFFARIKGVPASFVASEAARLLARLGIGRADADKDAATYSGGMRRKLSLAIALIGTSEILFLDEPSAAVDAGAKRLLWAAIRQRAQSQTVVITTHSMEEAEAVCDRIAIQVKGRLRCLGSPVHLKSRYGSGYQLEVMLLRTGQAEELNAAGERVTDFVRLKFSPQCALLESHGCRLLYQLPRLDDSSGLTLGRIFTGLHENREALSIEEYSLSQPSLEQVFIRFAREQGGEDAGTGSAVNGGLGAPRAP